MIINLKDIFEYQPNGTLLWRESPSDRIKAGMKAGGIHSSGYHTIKYLGRFFTRSRLIWELFNGPIPDKHIIIHKNGNILDDRIENLEAKLRDGMGRAQYKRNSKNRSGHLGVVHIAATGKYDSIGYINGKRQFLGRFDNIEEAVEARRKFDEAKYSQ